MPVDITPFPPAPPSISGQTLTIDTFLKTPAYVSKVMTDLSRQRFLADQIYGAGPEVVGGAVLYDQVIANDLYLQRDVHNIPPGSEFPVLNDQIPTPLVAAVAKWGGRIFVTDEDVRRNRIDLVRRALTKLRNTIVRKVDQIAIATLAAAPIQSYAFGSVWSSGATDILNGLTSARLLVDTLDMGYNLDTLVLNPAQVANLLGRADIRTAFGLMAQENIVRDASIGKLLNLNIYATNRVAAGTGYLLEAGAIGGIATEVPLTTKTYRDEDSEVTWIQASRIFVPYVTDPKAAIQLTGL